MQPEEEKKSKSPNPVLLAGLVLALGFMFYSFLTRKQPIEPPQRPAELIQAPRVVLPLPTGEKREEDRKDLVFIRPSRDPFLPPFIVRRKTTKEAKKNVVVSAKEKLPLRDEGFSRKGSDNVVTQPVWTGVLATSEGQVVIIRHNNRSYILHLGQIIPGTEYQLTEIRQEMVILKAPGKELRLRRKEGAK